MMFFPHENKLLPAITATIFLTLTLPISVSANTADWGMVQQFEKKDKLANQGNIQAMYDLGKLYERGRGTNVNLSSATKWYQSAADAGNTSAQARLGILYFEGRGVKQNYKIALTLLSSAAKYNQPTAQFQLANMYELGTGVTQSLKKSIMWYKKADQNGHYLANAKVIRLQKSLKNKSNVNPTTTSSIAKDKNASSPLIQTILDGNWLKRKLAVSYLPSNISNCSKDSYNSMHCISTPQERSTGSEIITYSTESTITATSRTAFNVEYRNNVISITLVDAESGDGEIVEQTASRIKKGKQGKKRSLTCILKNNKTSECSKGSTSFDLVRQ